MNIFDNKAIGERISTLRKNNIIIKENNKKSKETQYDLAFAINVTQTTISKIEKGNIKNVSIDILAKVANHYNVSLDYLCFGTGANSLLELLKSYVSLSTSNLSDDINNFKYPIIKVDKAFFDYLIRTENIKSMSNVPDKFMTQWINDLQKEFEKDKESNNGEKISFVPVPEVLIYPDQNKTNWKQQDLIREINNKWSI